MPPTPSSQKRQSRSSTRDLLEIAIAFALLEAALWSLGRTQLFWSSAALAWMIGATVLSGRSARALGIGLCGFSRSVWMVAAALGIAGIMIAIAALAGTLHILSGAHTPPSHIALYCVWAMLQEFLLQSFIFVRMEAVFGGSKAVIASAALFSLAHIPNPVLVPATFALGLALTAVFRRYRSLYPLGIVHGIFGLVLSVCLPYALTHNMRVGIAYFIG